MIELLGHVFKQYLNKDFLDHKFYKCDKCSTVIYRMDKIADEFYIQDWDSKYFTTPLGELTCDEMIIKSIIE